MLLNWRIVTLGVSMMLDDSTKMSRTCRCRSLNVGTWCPVALALPGVVQAQGSCGKKCIGWVRGEFVGCRGKPFKLSFSIHSASLESPECLVFGKDLIHGAWSGKDIRVQLSEASCRLYISRCITIFWRFRFTCYRLIFTVYSNIVLYHVDITDIHVFLIHPWGR